MSPIHFGNEIIQIKKKLLALILKYKPKNGDLELQIPICCNFTKFLGRLGITFLLHTHSNSF